MLGDTAVAVHPDDKRYEDLIGQEVILPLTDEKFQLLLMSMWIKSLEQDV